MQGGVANEHRDASTIPVPYVDPLEDVRARHDVVGERSSHALELRAAERRGKSLDRLPDRDVHQKSTASRSLVHLQEDESRLSRHELRLPPKEGQERLGPPLRNQEGVGQAMGTVSSLNCANTSVFESRLYSLAIFGTSCRNRLSQGTEAGHHRTGGSEINDGGTGGRDGVTR